MKKKKQSWMSHLERMHRSKLLAALVSTGQGCREVSEKFDVSDATVRNACKAHGVSIRHRACAKGKKRMGMYA